MTDSFAINLERGRRVAALLAGAWRTAPPPPCNLDPRARADIIPHVIKTGAGALAWWKVRGHDPGACPEFSDLQAIYQVHRLEAFMQQVRLEQTVQCLRRYGVEPLLSKGWSVARLYPEIGLRPYGDLDLHIDPSRAGDAYMALIKSPPVHSWVDLHHGVPELGERSFSSLYQRSRRLQVRDTPVRILSAEDQLRQLCLHFARHGGWRPLWLCDIGMLLESLPGDFDWDYCLAGDPRTAAWVRGMLGLAVRLLGARRDALPATFAPPPSSWLDPIVLGEWGRPEPGDSHSRDKTPMVRYLARPWLLWRGVRRRIPNAVEVAHLHHADPDADATLLWQRLRFCWSRMQRFARRLPSLCFARAVSDVTVHGAG
jgi:hypothetical protein